MIRILRPGEFLFFCSNLNLGSKIHFFYFPSISFSNQKMKLEHHISKPSIQAFEYLADVEKFVQIHPIIYKAKPLGNNEFLFFEKLSVLFFPVTVSYKATIVSNRDKKTVIMGASVMGILKINIVFEIAEISHGCKIVETVNFETRLPIIPVVEKIFKKQHLALFANMEKA